MGVSGTATASNLIMQTSYQKAPAQQPMMNKMLESQPVKAGGQQQAAIGGSLVH